MDDPDLIVVGGGVAGGALATVMARAGGSVLVLERLARYRDHVRGEILWPWGAQLARRMELERVLREAGALVVPWLDTYDEGAEGPTRDDVGAILDGAEGSISISHPAACAALADAAARAGADVRMGVRDVRITAGGRRLVRWIADDGAVHELSTALVVGADGRRSSIRSQMAVPFEIDPPAHLVAGMLVEGVGAEDDPVNVMARESDLLFFSFPQGVGRARHYLCFPADQRSRFTGSDGARRFLEASRLRCLDGVSRLHAVRQAGPCGTFPDKTAARRDRSRTGAS